MTNFKENENLDHYEMKTTFIEELNGKQLSMYTQTIYIDCKHKTRLISQIYSTNCGKLKQNDIY